MKKAIDPVTKRKKDNPRENDLPARVGKLTGNPASIKRNPRRVAVNSANVQDAPRKGWVNRLVFHMVIEALRPVSPSHKERGNAGSNASGGEA